MRPHGESDVMHDSDDKARAHNALRCVRSLKHQFLAADVTDEFGLTSI